MRLFYYFLLLFLVSTPFSHSKDKAYFAGGCFWCMEESFEMFDESLGKLVSTPVNKNLYVSAPESGHEELLDR